MRFDISILFVPPKDVANAMTSFFRNSEKTIRDEHEPSAKIYYLRQKEGSDESEIDNWSCCTVCTHPLDSPTEVDDDDDDDTPFSLASLPSAPLFPSCLEGNTRGDVAIPMLERHRDDVAASAPEGSGDDFVASTTLEGDQDNVVAASTQENVAVNQDNMAVSTLERNQYNADTFSLLETSALQPPGEFSLLHSAHLDDSAIAVCVDDTNVSMENEEEEERVATIIFVERCPSNTTEDVPIVVAEVDSILPEVKIAYNVQSSPENDSVINGYTQICSFRIKNANPPKLRSRPLIAWARRTRIHLNQRFYRRSSYL